MSPSPKALRKARSGQGTGVATSPSRFGTSWARPRVHVRVDAHARVARPRAGSQAKRRPAPIARSDKKEKKEKKRRHHDSDDSDEQRRREKKRRRQEEREARNPD